MVEGENGDNDAHPTSSAEKQILIFTFSITPLRDRKGDISPLVEGKEFDNSYQ